MSITSYRVVVVVPKLTTCGVPPIVVKEGVHNEAVTVVIKGIPVTASRRTEAIVPVWTTPWVVVAIVFGAW